MYISFWNYNQVNYFGILNFKLRKTNDLMVFCFQFSADRCHFYHQGASGNLGSFTYSNAQTCTWAIETPIGTDAYVNVSMKYI